MSDAEDLRYAFLYDCLAFVRELADCTHPHVGRGERRQAGTVDVCGVLPQVDVKITRCTECGAVRVDGSDWERTGYGARARALDAITRSGGPIARALHGA